MFTDILEIFTEAQSQGVRRRWVDPNDGFTMPKKGKSGLSRGVTPTESEFKERRAKYARADYRKRMADPVKAERVRELRRKRVQKWRAKQKAETSP